MKKLNLKPVAETTKNICLGVVAMSVLISPFMPYLAIKYLIDKNNKLNKNNDTNLNDPKEEA